MLLTTVETRKKVFEEDLLKCGLAAWEMVDLGPRLVMYETPQKRVTWHVAPSMMPEGGCVGYRTHQYWDEAWRDWKTSLSDVWFTDQEVGIAFAADAAKRTMYRK